MAQWNWSYFSISFNKEHLLLQAQLLKTKKRTYNHKLSKTKITQTFILPKHRAILIKERLI